MANEMRRVDVVMDGCPDATIRTLRPSIHVDAQGALTIGDSAGNVLYAAAPGRWFYVIDVPAPESVTS